MIGVVLIFQSLCQKRRSIEHISFDAASWLFITNARQEVTHYLSANQEFADASVRRNEQTGVLIAGVPYSSLSQIPFPYRRLLRRL